MPEGHTIHRLAQDIGERFGGWPVRTSSPQGRFTESAARLDGRPLVETDAHGKHLFLGFAGPASAGDLDWVHIHLGLYGTLRFGTGRPPAPTGQIRLRMVGGADPDQPPAHHADLRGPTRCEVLTDKEKAGVGDRLGPDPLRADADPDRAWSRISRSRVSVAALLLDQKVVAGVGNVYRAEVLFRHGIDPYRPGRELTRREWEEVWADLCALMRQGVRDNRIDTVRPEHTPEAMSRAPRVDDHGGEVYVYRRARQPCHVCGAEVRTADLAARNLFWCPDCQRR
ncbi:DNA-formamidopyrimidine glycosylase family protein [Streptomyces sp. NPDC005438]|uniref:Fpg/Nei family DNA glycosylase n=1 Tax=Streptomyces sp. NPDC005438 TaxID=3156880 RepID=UPI00339FDDAC